MYASPLPSHIVAYVSCVHPQENICSIAELLVSNKHHRPIVHMPRSPCTLWTTTIGSFYTRLPTRKESSVVITTKDRSRFLHLKIGYTHQEKFHIAHANLPRDTLQSGHYPAVRRFQSVQTLHKLIKF
jgi:hypothetical protein